MTTRDHALFVTTPRNLEGLLAAEIAALGAGNVCETRAGVACRGDATTALRLCLWSRLASRVLVQLGETKGHDRDALFAGIRELPWERHLPAGVSFAVDFVGHNAALRDSRYSARLTKDAVRARFHDIGLAPPVAEPRSPAIRCNIQLAGDRTTASIDLGGESLHRRGYRARAREAPLKENLAAALLLRAGWPDIAARGGPLIDPCCGSGTLLIEAALMAADIAPGLLRSNFGFHHWRNLDTAAWQALLDEARARAETGLAQLPRIHGADRDPQAVAAARANVRRARLDGHIQVEERPVEARSREAARATGLLITNPPWGHRLEAGQPVERLYMALGDWARQALPGWRLAVFTGHTQLLAALGLRSRRIYRFHNGRLPARLGIYDLAESPTAPVDQSASDRAPAALVNRLRKNHRHLRRWAQRERIGAWRVYDRDLPEYAFAVDLYASADGLYAHLAEYAPPAKIAPRKAERRRQQALAAVREAFELPASQVLSKIRRPRRAGNQYGRQDDRALRVVVTEGGARLRTNLSDRLDTGLYLDHRPLRQRIAREVAGRRFLNLFCYTGSATVHAALAGAHTTSIDLSRTYLDWLAENLRLNDLSPRRHRIVREDCVRWLADAAAGERYDVILLDPPSLSRSRAMRGDLDIQRDHALLIRQAAALLNDGGVLYFSTNRQRFQLDAVRLAAAALEIRDITAETLPRDFQRPPPAHRCWRIRHS